MEEVRKLILEIERLSIKFQLLHKELEHMQVRSKHGPSYYFIKMFMIIVLCFILKFYF